MFSNYIKKLKQGTVQEKKRMANIFAGITTLIIIVICILLSVFVKPLRNKEQKSLLGVDTQNFIQEITKTKEPFNISFDSI